VALRRLREGQVVTDTTGMLPEAEFAFLDEVFQGSTAILNTLLGILNERRFRRGHTQQDVPLRLCVAAANALPEDGSLAAFADRFLLHAFVQSVEDSSLDALLESGWGLRTAIEPVASLATLDALAAHASSMNLHEVRPALAEALRALRTAGVTLSDRRMVRSQALVAAAATLAGRSTATRADLWPLLFAVPSAEGQEAARDALRDHLAAAESPTLAVAAEFASSSPASRAARLLATAQALLARPDRDLPQIEALLRELDASLHLDDQPEALRQTRARLVDQLGSG
jgi:MoxR-like ATPase